MALSLRPRPTPQCPACLRNYALGGLSEIQRSPFHQQQVRGKKKLPNNAGTITVRLLKDVKAYGRKGAIVPIPTGAMRNSWYPSRIAEYVTMPELKRLRLNNVAMERDFEFGMTSAEKGISTAADANAEWQKDIPSDIKGMTNAQLRSASAFERAKMEPDKVSPERSMELVELFVPPRLEFYRQIIVEEKEVEKPVAEPIRIGGAAGDLLAARSRVQPKEKLQAIYGSVSAQDVLVAVRAVMSNNDEAARVVLHESEIQLVGLPGEEGSEAGRVKHIGDFVVEIKVRGSETPIQRTVRVLPQET